MPTTISRDFAYCDSGMIPWLLTIALLSETGQSLSTLVENMIAKFRACSGEINFKVADTQTTIQKIFDFYADQNPQIDQKTDGVSLDFGVHGALTSVLQILSLCYVLILKAVQIVKLSQCNIM